MKVKRMTKENGYHNMNTINIGLVWFVATMRLVSSECEDIQPSLLSLRRRSPLLAVKKRTERIPGHALLLVVLHKSCSLRGGNDSNNAQHSRDNSKDPRVSESSTPIFGNRRHPVEIRTTVPNPGSTTSSLPIDEQSSSSPSEIAAVSSPSSKHDPVQMYMSCMLIVFIWISCGTIFYSICNSWPFAQSFFYAVDAGMSIGFCIPDVAEHKLISKAFTIIYILLGASVVGGALALFIQDSMEGLATNNSQQYKLLLEKETFDAANVSRTGALSFSEFQQLLVGTISSRGGSDQSSSILSDDDILLLWKKFDKLKDGVIHFEEFTGTFRGVERLVQSLREQQKSSRLRRTWFRLRSFLQEAWQLEHRIYFVFVLWVSMGILWGIFDQGWDPITATHFAISALATGGLTAPSVNADGILPPDPSIFCGIFCLFGIPLFALTLGHYARYLVAGHVTALEESALSRPITRVEFDFAKRLTTPEDPLVHLSDFIVLQLLRQGKISMTAINVMKQNFDALDVDHNGSLSYDEIRASPDK